MFDFVLNFLMHGVTHASWVAKLVYFFIVTQLTIFSVTLYLHRSQAHRGVDFYPLLAHFFRFWLWLTTGMVTKEWVAIHRKHHAKVETADDPHSPLNRRISIIVMNRDAEDRLLKLLPMPTDTEAGAVVDGTDGAGKR